MSTEAEPEVTFEAALAAVQAAKAKQAPSTEVPQAESAAPAEGHQPPPPVTPAPSSQPDVAPVATTAAPSDQSKSQEPAPGKDLALKQLLDREAALQEREKQIVALERAKRKFKSDPVSAIREIAPDVSLSQIAKVLWEEDLGDLAPVEAKQSKELRGVRSEVEELRLSLESERQRLAEEKIRYEGEQAMNQYVGAIRSSVKELEASKFPLVSKFTQKHPDGVVEEMLSIARRHSFTGEVLMPDQILDQLEKQLGRYQLADGPAPQVSQTVATSAPQTPTSIRNTHTQTQPSLQPANELDDEYLREQALKAVREDRKRRGLG